MPSDISSNASTLTDTLHYVVGPDAAGHWLAVETHGSGGGLFVSLDAALHYARSETGRREGAVDLVERLVAFAIVTPGRDGRADPEPLSLTPRGPSPPAPRSTAPAPR